MNKRKVGELLCNIADISVLSLLSCTPYGAAGNNPLHLLWAAPLALITSPLIPVCLYGEKLLNESYKEEFLKKSEVLPKIDISNMKYAYIAYHSHDQFDNEKYYISKNYYNELESEPIYSLQEAREWLIYDNFVEVVATNYPDVFDTYWIKKTDLPSNHVHGKGCKH